MCLDNAEDNMKETSAIQITSCLNQLFKSERKVVLSVLNGSLSDSQEKLAEYRLRVYFSR